MPTGPVSPTWPTCGDAVSSDTHSDPAGTRDPASGAPHPGDPHPDLPPSSGAPVDVLLTGTVFFDLVFTGLASMPAPGREIRTGGLGASPGGVANLAVALRRLGLSVRLDAAFATDLFGDYLWRTLAVDEGVDLSGSIRVPDWATPLTVSLAHHDDRSLVTYERPQPVSVPSSLDAERPAARAFFACLSSHPHEIARAHRAGMLVFADVGWDESERWVPGDLDTLRHVDAFLPNCDEATAYTRTATAEDAACVLAGRVPLVVVKCGRNGAVAWEAGAAEPLVEGAIDVEAIDPTGAGDVFDAAFVYATLSGWGLRERLRFANLCAGLSVRHHGGSLSAPSWGEIAEWVRRQPDAAARYGFLRPLLAGEQGGSAPRRARPTI